MKKITIDETWKKKELGDLFGLFFEDINHAADGGMYGELLQNRSFEFCEIDRAEYNALTAWEKSGGLCWEIRSSEPIRPENCHYLHVEAHCGDYIANRGYSGGIYMEKGKVYDFSLWARCSEGTKIELEIGAAEEGRRPEKTAEQEKTAEPQKTGKDAVEQPGKPVRQKERALGRLTIEGSGWKKYEISLTATETTCSGLLYIRFLNAGSCEFDMVSLFPRDTFRGRKNGMRADIAQALCDMKPKFMRFPGGCLVHKGSLDENARNSMYRWEKTVGPLEERPARRNIWGYNQTLGIGYYEYFLFCEDIGAKPVPVLPGGFNPHTGEGVPMEEIGKWVQEALDLIEFAGGGPETRWGGIRAEMGHPEPFDLEYLAIGNEEIGAGFYERYPYFHNAIRRRYPEIKIINSAGPFAEGEGYEAGWASAKKYGSDLIDEHYYNSPEWFLANMHHYEDYDEKGPKVFLGEYASKGSTYYNALVEAAYMTHLERSPAVRLACYAPMLCNVDYVNWKPNMLWFDNHRIMKTANYHVQKLFMEYQGTDEVAFTMEGLDEVIPLIEKEILDGSLSLRGNDVAGKIWNIRITDVDRNIVVKGSDFEVNGENAEFVLGGMDSGHYVLEFNFRRTDGRKGLKVFFGKRDENNYLCWDFGGGDNWDSNLNVVENGRSCVISHRIFRVDEREYHLKLEVEGLHIRTWINGEKFNDVVYRLPELEELYVAASLDRVKGETILKAVNLCGEEKAVRLCLKGKPKSRVRELCLRDHGLTEENTFETPEKIAPVESMQSIAGNELEHVFPAHSFTVLVFSA